MDRTEERASGEASHDADAQDDEERSGRESGSGVVDGHLPQLHACLRDYFAVDDDDFIRFMEENSTFIELYSGDVLIEQGARDDDVFFVLSGRLRAILIEADGSRRVLGDIGRGEPVGELAMFTDEARSAEVAAIRNSLVARVSRKVVEQAIGRQPELALVMTRHVISRFRRQQQKTRAPAPPVIVTILPVGGNIDIQSFVHRLADAQKPWRERIAILDSDTVHERFGHLSRPDILRPRGEISTEIGAMEGEHDAIFLIGDPEDSVWSTTAIHHADEILLVANADDDPAPGRFEKQMLEGDHSVQGRVALVLLHPAGAVAPRGTSRWLAARKVDRHFHIRPTLDRDMRRLGRILTGNAIGIVFAGGGARGFAHIGVACALTEMGVEFDYVGGTSAGAIMGAFLSMEVEGDDFIDMARRVFVTSRFGNLTGDYSYAPLVSLIKGQRARQITDMLVAERTGGQELDLEDTWKTFFVVASNFTKHREQVLMHGDFARNLVASFSIPGLFPPVLKDGEVLFDGGSFNNFPVDVMRGKLGAGKIIGVDLLPNVEKRYNLEDVPSPRAILMDALLPRRKRRYRLPSLPDTLLTASIVTAMARQKAMRDEVDMLFQPNVRGVSMLDWKKYDQVVGSTYKQALGRLKEMEPSELAAFVPPPAT
ncbi:patatin-like phospholipase family protein [Oricola indica]|uniref:patatin-like phospholipase family protein n=1 Tax=Oricola indica TaxID=2872591 RepID=UPI003CCBD9E6